MQKVREYRHRAQECRQLGNKAVQPELRAHYERMADIWDKLAEERLAFFVDHPEEDADGEVADDGATA